MELVKGKVKWLILFIEIVIIIFLLGNLEQFKKLIDPKANFLIKNYNEETDIVEISPIPTINLEIVVTPTVETKKKVILPKPTIDNEPWGMAKQIGEVTWTIKLGEDERIGTPKEIFDALNEYRKVQGSQVLTWDEKLGNYAQERAKYLNGIKSVDQHQGFNDFVKNQDGFNKLGFTALGENISYGYKLNGTHIIEWMYAGDKPHNDNQLNNKWNYVGIGVDGLATCLIFGTGKF